MIISVVDAFADNQMGYRSNKPCTTIGEDVVMIEDLYEVC